MGCKLSVSVIHPEGIVKKIKETMSPKVKEIKCNNKVSPEDTTDGQVEENTDEDKTPDSPCSIDIYKTIYLDSP